MAIAWIIGLLPDLRPDRLPQAAHDWVSEVFSTEKRRGVLCFGCWPCGLCHPPRAPLARCPEYMRPYLSPTWAARPADSDCLQNGFCSPNNTPEPILPMPAPQPCYPLRCPYRPCLPRGLAAYACLSCSAKRSHGPRWGLKRRMEGACPP